MDAMLGTEVRCLARDESAAYSLREAAGLSSVHVNERLGQVQQALVWCLLPVTGTVM